MQLRYSPTSPYVRKCMVVAIETGLVQQIEKIPTNVSPITFSPEVAAVNPLVKVPALAFGDGEVLYDSPVICEYLDSLHSGPKLFPEAGAARWTALRRQALADGILDAALLFRYELTRPEAIRWAEWSDGQMAKVRSGLDALEMEAENLDGPLDIGQITVGCALGYLDFRFASEAWRANRPKLDTWYKGFAERQSMIDTQPPL